MKSLLLALQFLTIIPVRISNIPERGIVRCQMFFPVIGLLIGLLPVVLRALGAAAGFHGFSLDIITVVALAAVTGGLHLDGLADCADACFSRKPREEMLAVMRDPHAGSAGVIAVVSLLLLKIAALHSLTGYEKTAGILLACTVSRGALVLVMKSFAYARAEGKAKIFMAGTTTGIMRSTLAVVLVLAFLIYGVKGIIVTFAGGLCAYAAARFARGIFGGITGDVLGAVCEVTELAVLFWMVVVC
ncbi:MAG: adenosylcobinamide-GDP ribazoletransferase [Candidatus Omnitrophica bacterium]|nr:adenosylcobinamide-GDP ribazoletransferase [Candidatus Omnitrophota bacterium]